MGYFSPINTNNSFTIDLATGAVKSSGSGGDGVTFLTADLSVFYEIDAHSQFDAYYVADSTVYNILTYQVPLQVPLNSYNGILFAENAGALTAVNESSLATVWNISLPSYFAGQNSSPALSGDGVFVMFSCNQGAQYAAATGKVRWHTSARSGCTPVQGNSVSALYGNSLYTYTAGSGTVSVASAVTGAYYGSFLATDIPVIDGSVAYVHNGGQIYAVATTSPSFQKILWSFGGDGAISTPPLVVNGQVIVGSSKGNLYVLNAKTGALLSTTVLPGAIASGSYSSIAAGENTLVVPVGANQLYAFQTK